MFGLYHRIILRLMEVLRFLSRVACLGWLFCPAAVGSEASPIPSIINGLLSERCMKRLWWSLIQVQAIGTAKYDPP
jgi:hypothetical protein